MKFLTKWHAEVKKSLTDLPYGPGTIVQKIFGVDVTRSLVASRRLPKETIIKDVYDFSAASSSQEDSLSAKRPNSDGGSTSLHQAKRRR